MSIHIIKMIWRTPEIDLSPVEIAVFTCLASYSNDAGSSVYPSISRIVDETRFSRATVKRAIKEISKKGFIEKISEHDRSHNLTNVYRINIDLIEKIGSLEKKKETVPTKNLSTDGITEIPRGITGSLFGGFTLIPDGITLNANRFTLSSKQVHTDTLSTIINQEEGKYIRAPSSKSFSSTTDDECSHELAQKNPKEIISEKKEKRGCRLDPEVVLTDEWINILVNAGIHGSHKKTVFTLFVNYWVSKPGKDGIKLDWKKTWQNWCINGLRFDKKLKYSEQSQSAGGTSEDLVMMGIDRHAAYKKFEKTGNPEDAPKELTIDDMLEKCGRMTR
jgi:DNA-binding MarR family transcriptional regulator